MTHSRSTDGSPGEELTPQQVREAAGRALGDLLGGGKGKALTAEERAELRDLCRLSSSVRMTAADVLALLDATEAEDG